MKNQDSSALACRHCRYFHHEGRRGGCCEKLDAHVRGDWKPCPLMIPSFSASWQDLEEILPIEIERPDPAFPRAKPSVPIKTLAQAS